MTNKQLLEKVRELVEKNNAGGTCCPNCGRCHACGRGGWGTQPWYPYVPTYPYQPLSPWWTTTTTTDLMPCTTGNDTLAKWGKSMTGGDTSHMVDT